MFCPNCGRDCADANFCPNCGQKIISSNSDVPKNIQEPPIGLYKGNDGYVEVSFQTLTVYKELPFKTVEKLMSFRDIKDVRFQQANETENGFLAIREMNDCLPVSETEWDAVVDEAALTFDVHKNEQFLNVYAFLSYCKEVVQTKTRLTREVRNTCPKCKSSSIRNRLVTVPVVHRIEDEYICCSCGYQWNARSILKRQMNGLSKI